MLATCSYLGPWSAKITACAGIDPSCTRDPAVAKGVQDASSGGVALRWILLCQPLQRTRNDGFGSCSLCCFVRVHFYGHVHGNCLSELTTLTSIWSAYPEPKRQNASRQANEVTTAPTAALKLPHRPQRTPVAQQMMPKRTSTTKGDMPTRRSASTLRPPVLSNSIAL